MASLSEELNKAAEGLSKFNRQIADLTRASGNGLGNGGTAFSAGLGAAFGGALLGAISGAGQAATYGAQVFSTTGSLSDAAGSTVSRLIERTAQTGVGALVSGALGESREIAGKLGAREQVGDALSALARANVPISDEFLQGFIDQKVKQTEREFDFRQRVAQKTEYSSADATAGAVGDQAIATTLEKVADTLDALRNFMESVPLFRSGGQ